MPTVSVILTCYNGERWIEETIKSVVSQTLTDFELLIINDGSMDNSERKIFPFLSDKRVKYFYQENKGIPAARNRGLKIAKGEFICILDQDDLWLPEKLALQVEYLSRHTDVGIVYTGAYHINEEGNIIGQRKPFFKSNGFLLKEMIKKGNLNPIGASMIRKECFITVGLLDENLYGCDDYEFWLRVAKEYKFGYLNLRLTKFRYHSSVVRHKSLDI